MGAVGAREATASAARTRFFVAETGHRRRTTNRAPAIAIGRGRCAILRRTRAAVTSHRELQSLRRRQPATIKWLRSPFSLGPTCWEIHVSSKRLTSSVCLCAATSRRCSRRTAGENDDLPHLRSAKQTIHHSRRRRLAAAGDRVGPCPSERAKHPGVAAESVRVRGRDDADWRTLLERTGRQVTLTDESTGNTFKPQPFSGVAVLAWNAGQERGRGRSPGIIGPEGLRRSASRHSGR